MKRITCALLSLFMITPCFANIHIRSEAVESVIKQKIPGQDAQVAALAEYNAQVKKANNAGIPASGIWQVCKAAGWNTQTADGEAKCRDFGNTLMKYATWKFKAVCGDYKSLVQKGTGRCVDDVFSNKVLGGVKVNMLVAPGLAKEYARVKYSDKDLVCSKNYRQTTVPPDDYVQCLSMNKNMAYEFRFDSVTATMDNTINEGTESGVCKIFGLKYSPLGVTLDTAYSKGTSWPAACETTDAKICGKVNESMAKFGRSAKIGTTGSTGNKHSACVITKNAISSPSQLRTAFGIDNYVFKKGGVQLNATQALKTQVCTYVRTTVKSPAITSCDCNDGFTQLYDFSGMITQVDDVLTCKINGKNVDFVFDDLSERNRRIATGGSQGMDCMAAGGTYAGQQCMYLDEKQCKMLAKANLQNCPTCKKVEYKNGVCQLPSGADAVQALKDQRIALIVGGAVVGVVVTVASAGTAGAPVAAVVFTLVETGGAVIEYNAQVKIDGIADEFLLTSIKCKSASCAEKLVKENLQRMSNVAGDMQTAERNAVDKELARLVGLLPNDSQLFIDILGGESLTEANHKPLFDADSWEPEQVWRAVGITLQMTSIFGAVGKWVLKSTGILAKDLPEATIKITSKAKLAREGIIKAGKTVKTTDGKVIVPMGRMAAVVDKSNPLVISAKTKLSYYGQSFDDIYKGFKQGGGYPGWWKVSDLTPDELNALNKYYLAADEYKLMNDGSGNLIFKYIGSGKQSVAQAAERFDDYGRGFLKRFNYDVDARPKTWQDVLQKWDLPSNATDDMIEARYKAMMEDLRLYDTKGDPYIMSNQGDLIGSVQTDYTIIKETKPSFANARQTSKTIVSQALYDAGKTHINNEQALARRLGLSIKKDAQLMRYEEDYMNALAKANSNADVENAWRTYHQNIVNYLTTKFNRSRTLQVARQRQDMYIDIIASDPNLVDKALGWKTLSSSDKGDFLRTLLERSNRRLCTGGSCSLSMNGGLGGATNYMHGGSIEIGLAEGTVKTSTGCTRTIRPNDSLDDAILAFSHEHGHSITLNSPRNSSLDDDIIGLAIIHNEDEASHTFTGIRANSGNYDRQILEQEALTIGDEVGNGFESKLMDRLERNGITTQQPTRPTTSTTTTTTSATTSATTQTAKATTKTGKTADDVVNELWSEAEYIAERPMARDLDELSDKWRILQYNGGPISERENIMFIQQKMEAIENVFRANSDMIDTSEEFERLWYVYNEEKKIAEEYIERTMRRL